MESLALLERAIHQEIALLLSIIGHHLGGNVSMLQVGGILHSLVVRKAGVNVHRIVLCIGVGTVRSFVRGHHCCLVAHEHWVCVLSDGGSALEFVGMSVLCIISTV